MDGHVWTALRTFAALFAKIPMIKARVMVQSAVLLIAFPGLMALWLDQPDMAFVLCQTVRFSLHWRAQFAHKARRDGTGRKRMVGAFMIAGAVIFAAKTQNCASMCQVSSVRGLRFCLAWTCWTAANSPCGPIGQAWFTPPSARELTQAMLVLHLIYIVLNETMVAAVSLQGWVVFYACMPLLHHVLLTAVFRTVFWVTPNPGRGSKS
jgi:hypothetical protein